ncbi:MAG: hypothetical protein WA639_22580 [Candidatus Acidiferrum sp.]
MTSRSRIHTPFLIGFIFLILGLFPAKALAQTDGYLTNSNTRGLEASNPFQVGDIDNINLANGALNLRIPVFQRKGRGGRLDRQYFFSYTSKIWSFFPIWDPLNPTSLDALDWSISPEIANAVLLPLSNASNVTLWGNEILNYDENFWGCTINNIDYTTTAAYNFQYKMPDGSAYRLANLHYDTSPNDGHKCTSLSQVNVGYSEMGGIKLDSTAHPYMAQLKDGARNNAESDQLLDTNGNFINANGISASFDTLGRTVGYTDQPPLQTWTFTDSNGATQQVTELLPAGASSSTQFPSASCGVVPINQYTGTMGGTNTLTMPDGRTYVLTFDPNFDEVTNVSLPTGGYIRYQYTTLAAFDQSPNLGQCGPGNGMDSRRISARFVSPDGNPQHEQQWQYAYAYVSSTSTYTTTVTDPLGNVTVHSFNTLGIDQRTHETMTQYYDNAGHLLRTVSNTWSHNSRPVASYPYGKFTSTRTTSDLVDWQITTTTTTLADTNQVKEVDTTYDSFSCGTSCTASLGNVLSQSEYDWGSGTHGSLLRRTVYTYLHDSNSNYLNKHIVDRVSSKTTYDSANNTCQGQSRACAQTTWGYDTTTIAAKAGVVQHDYTDYPSTMTYRGNPTTISSWRNTDGALLTTTNYYNELGNLIQTSDPLSHNTYFDYTDSWSGTACIEVVPPLVET